MRTFSGFIDSDSVLAHRVIDDVMRELRSGQWDDKARFAVELVFEEAFINAIEHGNCNNKAKRVHYECRLDDDRVYIRVEDEGCGFDPDSVADPSLAGGLAIPSGRGIHLIRGFATRVEWNDKGNAVEIEIDRETS